MLPNLAGYTYVLPISALPDIYSLTKNCTHNFPGCVFGWLTRSNLESSWRQPQFDPIYRFLDLEKNSRAPGIEISLHGSSKQCGGHARAGCLTSEDEYNFSWMAFLLTLVFLLHYYSAKDVSIKLLLLLLLLCCCLLVEWFVALRARFLFQRVCCCAYRYKRYRKSGSGIRFQIGKSIMGDFLLKQGMCMM